MAVATVSPGRECAYAVLRRVFEQDAWADRAFHGEARRLGLDPRDRGLALRMAYGAVQRKATLDHLIERFAERPIDQLDRAVVAALRLGLQQIVYLDRVPAHAAVTESVELAKRDAPRGAGLVNAVLRRAAREATAIVDALPEGTPEEAALKHSHPEWVARMWWEEFGPDTARALMAAGNEAAEPSLRVNTLRTTRDELAAALPVATRPADHLPEGLVLEEPFDSHGSPLHEQGLFMPQSRAAMAVARAVAPRPGERILDLCAAPGGKTTHLAALMDDQGEIVSVERHAGRAEALRRTAERMGATCVTVVTADARTPPEGPFDRVLVDPPCSDLGTLSSRPDARWRKSPQDVERLAAIQRDILEGASSVLRPGGTLVYSTCTLSPAENEGNATALGWQTDRPSDLPVWDHPSVPAFLMTLPHRDGTEGFFIARMVSPA